MLVWINRFFYIFSQGFTVPNSELYLNLHLYQQTPRQWLTKTKALTVFRETVLGGNAVIA